MSCAREKKTHTTNTFSFNEIQLQIFVLKVCACPRFPIPVISTPVESFNFAQQSLPAFLSLHLCLVHSYFDPILHWFSLPLFSFRLVHQTNKRRFRLAIRALSLRFSLFLRSGSRHSSSRNVNMSINEKKTIALETSADLVLSVVIGLYNKAEPKVRLVSRFALQLVPNNNKTITIRHIVNISQIR